jgi:high-affinity Fe2+/Pb2+ permease
VFHPLIPSIQTRRCFLTTTLLTLAIFVIPVLLVLVPLEMWHLRKDCRKEQRRVSAASLFGISLLSILSSAAIGLCATYLVMFGPSHATGDFVGLPWFTMLPALAVGGWLAKVTSKFVGQRLLRSARNSRAETEA